MKMTEDQRAFIVMRFAMFDKPRAVVQGFKEQFGVEVGYNQITPYNLDYIGINRKMAKKWQALFIATRENFLTEIAKSPIAERAFRLRRLNEMHETALDKGNLVLAASLLEQAAKESGGLLTNKQVVEGKVEHNHTTDFSAEENRARLVAALSDAIGSEAPATKH